MKKICLILLLVLIVVFGVFMALGKTKNKVCCEFYGFGAMMVKCCEKYEWTKPEECIAGNVVGGGRQVVDDSFCK